MKININIERDKNKYMQPKALGWHIIINESFINGIRITIREVVNDKLQQAYKQENRRETDY